MTSCSLSVNTNLTYKFKMQIKRIQTEQEANLSSLRTYKSPIIALVVSRLVLSSVVCKENANYHLWRRKTAPEVGVFHAYCYQPASNQSSRKLQTSSKDCVTGPREPKLGLIMAIIDGKIVSMIVKYR